MIRHIDLWGILRPSDTAAAHSPVRDPLHPQQPHRHRRKTLQRQRSVKGGFIALHGEAGYQPEVLRGGLHYLMPIQYVVHIMPLVTITQGQIGYIFARDGEPLEPMQVLASNVTANDFQDVDAFLNNGGQRGPQRQILREGTYAINLAQFVVITEERVYYLPLSRDDAAVIQSMSEVDLPSATGSAGGDQGYGRPDRHRDRP